ncbi:hypothetical protein Pyn_37591 [Prunus yedoensis var. nudiflora]|uniref:Uncharacterized protein n=1 Tax=Prunus yedoensis var. nudiflora TaxID=2094558 RepID=A0A314Y2A5_PRUYE|nr:hypothetical protein Pyn_37591 [Prunus yedoensis var. nudiflora]
MAPKRNPTTALESSSSETAFVGPAFISGVGVKEFAIVFDGCVERFAVGRVQIMLYKDLISFARNHCILGPRYLD